MIGVWILLPACLMGAQGPQFAPPVRLKGGKEFVKVGAPGYACPTWADVDGDGQSDLVVGQFAKGKMRLYRNLGKGELASGQWLKAGDEVAEVPGVW